MSIANNVSNLATRLGTEVRDIVNRLTALEDNEDEVLIDFFEGQAGVIGNFPLPIPTSHPDKPSAVLKDVYVTMSRGTSPAYEPSRNSSFRLLYDPTAQTVTVLARRTAFDTVDSGWRATALYQ